MIKINNWCGRLCNNLLQIKNILHISLHYNYKISIPYHKFINNDIINNYKYRYKYK